MITFVKKNGETENVVVFEILTRSAFNGYDFEMNIDEFNNTFRYSENNRITPNISDDKSDVYECLERKFLAKMEWWNENINKVEKLDNSGVFDDRYELMNIKDFYVEEFECSHFDFMKDRIYYNNLFNTSRELVYEERG